MLRLVTKCSLLLLLTHGATAQCADCAQPNKQAKKLGADWWTVSDSDFVTQYGKLAVGNQADQSRFAWMSFARANQQVAFGTKPQTVSQWELWASDLDTFSPNVPAFVPANKILTRPHLEPIQQLQMFNQHSKPLQANPFPTAGQEVTRNSISYNYIMNTHLNTQQGIADYLGQKNAKIEFPVGAVETKAFWVRGSIAGTYQLGGFSMTALHLMVKIKPTPTNPFTDNSPSWFWTTFEFNSNNGLAAVQRFIMYGDKSSAADAQTFLQQAGLTNTAFVNYVSNGQQIQFFDAVNKAIVLGNTQLEWPFAAPPSQDPNTWTSWSSSCHSCHAQASGHASAGGMNVFGFTAPVGPLAGGAMPPANYRSYDFVWALMLAQ